MFQIFKRLTSIQGFFAYVGYKLAFPKEGWVMGGNKPLPLFLDKKAGEGLTPHCCPGNLSLEQL
jgi:hypothetical protein